MDNETGRYPDTTDGLTRPTMNIACFSINSMPIVDSKTQSNGS